MDLRSARNKNYYELLGATKESDSQEIRSRYHELARVYHPDSNFYSDITSEKVSAEQIELFKIITSAYHTLIDPQKRKEYDSQLAPAFSDKLRVWEESSDSFFDINVNLLNGGTSPAPKRQRVSTFGQTGVRPHYSVQQQEKNRRKRRETSIKDALMTKNRKRTRTIFIASFGMLLGVVCLFALVLNTSIDGTRIDRGGPQNSQSNEPIAPKAPAAWRNTLDG